MWLSKSEICKNPYPFTSWENGFSSVYVCMFFQITIHRKCCSTDFTRKGFLSLVCLYVYSYSALYLQNMFSHQWVCWWIFKMDHTNNAHLQSKQENDVFPMWVHVWLSNREIAVNVDFLQFQRLQKQLLSHQCVLVFVGFSLVSLYTHIFKLEVPENADPQTLQENVTCSVYISFAIPFFWIMWKYKYFTRKKFGFHKRLFSNYFQNYSFQILLLPVNKN